MVEIKCKTDKEKSYSFGIESRQTKIAMINGKSNLLIDDYIKNIHEWEAKGGIGVHHTSPSNTLAELKRLGFK